MSYSLNLARATAKQLVQIRRRERSSERPAGGVYSRGARQVRDSEETRKLMQAEAGARVSRRRTARASRSGSARLQEVPSHRRESFRIIIK